MGKRNESIDRNAPARVRREVKRGVRRSRRAEERRYVAAALDCPETDVVLHPRHTHGWSD